MLLKIPINYEGSMSLLSECKKRVFLYTRSTLFQSNENLRYKVHPMKNFRYKVQRIRKHAIKFNQL